MIRIVVAHMPRMLRDIIEGAIRLQPDMQLLNSGDAAAALNGMDRHRPDVAIVADRATPEASPSFQLLAEYPALKMFVVTEGGRGMHRLELQRIPVVPPSPHGLVDAIRAACSDGPTCT